MQRLRKLSEGFWNQKNHKRLATTGNVELYELKLTKAEESSTSLQLVSPSD